MARPPVLETARLKLVPFTENYLTERYVSWLNDAAVVRYSEQRHRTHSVESRRAYMRSFEGLPDYFWAIVARDQAVGHLGNMAILIDAPNLLADVTTLNWRA
jgi:hypothetical protein